MADSDIHPTPDEIKQYVAVGPSPDYSITVHKSTFDTGFLLFTIIFGAALIIFVIIMIIVSYNITKTKPIPRVIVLGSQSETINSNYGAASYASYPVNKNLNGSAFTTQEECLSNTNTIWENNKCDCISPFFGETCSREKHDSKYFAAGIPDESNLGLSIIDEIPFNNKRFINSSDDQRVLLGKSFNEQGTIYSCSDYCDKNPNCNAFIYHPNDICSLLTSDIVVPKGSTITYSSNIDPTLYVKSTDNIKFDHRVFLGAYPWSFPNRYWLFNQTDDYIQIIPGIIYKIAFYPESFKMHGEYTGIYCPFPFTYDNINDIITNNNTTNCYIHEPNTNLNIPLDFKYKTIYVTYI